MTEKEDRLLARAVYLRDRLTTAKNLLAKYRARNHELARQHQRDQDVIAFLSALLGPEGGAATDVTMHYIKQLETTIESSWIIGFSDERVIEMIEAFLIGARPSIEDGSYHDVAVAFWNHWKSSIFTYGTKDLARWETDRWIDAEQAKEQEAKP